MAALLLVAIMLLGAGAQGLQLKKHGIHQLVAIGFIARTCVESTIRFGASSATRSR